MGGIGMKKDKDELSETVSFRLTRREKDRLKCLADRDDVKPSEWIRNHIFKEFCNTRNKNL